MHMYLSQTFTLKMQTKLHTALVALLFTAFVSYADNKLTVRNSETGESFEVSVPAGLEIQEYDPALLDSVPYLTDHARYGESWAYEALADCHRHGKGGLKRSMFMAMAFYELAGINPDNLAKDLISADPSDTFGLTCKLLGCMENGDKTTASQLLDTLDRNGYDDAEVLRSFLDDTDTDSLTQLVIDSILSPEISTDRMMFTVFGCLSRDLHPESLRNNAEMMKAVVAKYPYFQEKFALDFFRSEKEAKDSSDYETKRRQAIEWLERADKAACLSPEGATILYEYYKSEQDAGRILTDEKEMNRLAILTKLH